MNKKMKKLLKRMIIVLIIIAIILGIIIYNNRENKNEITNQSGLLYTEDEAKNFYTKVLIKYLDTFQNDFHIKYKAETIKEDGEKLVNTEEFSKKGNITSLYFEEENVRMLLDGENMYNIDENNYYIFKLNKEEEEINTNMDVLFYTLVSINDNFVNLGRETIKDVNYYFEEYTMATDKFVLVRYYFDEDNNIKFIKKYKENSKEQTLMEILMLEDRTYDFMFDMSDRYNAIN